MRKLFRHSWVRAVVAFAVAVAGIEAVFVATGGESWEFLVAAGVGLGLILALVALLELISWIVDGD